MVPVNRVISVLACVWLGVLLSVGGGGFRSRFWSGVISGFGFTLIGFGFLLLWLTTFHWSWGWWL
jgi:hypothetical protein